MLKHSDSVDSTYRLRTNPLNIRNHDGTDLILSKVDRLGQMAENRRPVSQIYPGPRQSTNMSYRPRDDVYDDSDNESISEESGFVYSTTRSSHVVQEQLEHIRSAQRQTSKQRPMSYPNFSTPQALEKPIVPKNRPKPRSETENISLSLSKEITMNKEQLQKDGVDIVNLAIPTGGSFENTKQAKPVVDLGPPKFASSKSSRDFPSHPSNANRQSFQLGLSLPSPDLSSLMSEFSDLSFESKVRRTPQLGRKNTITSPNASIQASPSKAAPAVFERMRSLRKSQSKEFMNNSSLVSKAAKPTRLEPVYANQEFTIPVPERSPKRPAPEPKQPVYCAPEKPVVTQVEAKALPNPQHAEVSQTPTPISMESNYRSLDPDAPRRALEAEKELKRLEDAKEAQKEQMRIESVQEESFEESIEEPSYNEELDSSQEPSVGSPVLSVYSFDSHMVNQLCCIPSPIMNAISFTPPLGAAVPSSEDEDVSDIESIFSQGSESVKKDIDETSISGSSEVSTETQESSIHMATVSPIDPEDRGRLFVRIEGLSQLGLPVVGHRHPRFNMTLDNGVQSVTIDPIPIKSTNPGVGQEFELVVGTDLQFILTFHAQMDALPEPGQATQAASTASSKSETRSEASSQPKSPQQPTEAPLPAVPAVIEQPVTPPISPKKQSRFRSMFGSSPKKKQSTPTKESPVTMAAQRQQTPARPNSRPGSPVKNTQDTKPNMFRPKPKDMWDGLIGPQGEFGRCYLVASQYEPEVYGRARTFNLSLFDEWGYKEEVEESEPSIVQGQPTLASLVPSGNASAGKNNNHNSYNNRKSGRQNQTKKMVALNDFGVSRPRKTKKVALEPFRIATVQITLMYIPRVNMVSPIPTSIKNAGREFALIQSYRNTYLEGYLSQEGGDCNYWRRRWFELRGGTLIGHTEDSHKVRNVLNLANVQKIMDVATMTASEKSEMYGVCMYEDRSFRIAFNDGEVINFYADNAARKNEWVSSLLTATTYCTGKSYTWVDNVMEHQAEEKAKAAEAQALRLRHPAALSAAAKEVGASALADKSRRKGKTTKKASFAERVLVHTT